MFVRLPKGVKPTEEGEKFYQKCKTALNHIKIGIEHLKNFDNNIDATLTIGASHDILNFVLMPKIIEFAKEFKNIKFNFVETISSKLPKFLETGEIDIAFLEDKSLSGNFECRHYMNLENVFFASNKNMDLKNFENEKFVIFKKNSINNQSFEKFKEDNNVEINAQFLVSNFSTMSSLCKNLNAIGFSPKIFLTENYIPLNFEQKISPTILNVCHQKRENLSFATSKFLEFIEKY